MTKTKKKKFKSGHDKRLKKQKQLLIEQEKTCKKINNFLNFLQLLKHLIILNKMLIISKICLYLLNNKQLD